jgi:hypothetical protein
MVRVSLGNGAAIKPTMTPAAADRHKRPYGRNDQGKSGATGTACSFMLHHHTPQALKAG